MRVCPIPGALPLSALPVLPLPNVVLLPGMMLPLNVHEPRYLELIDFVRQSGQHIGVPLVRLAAPNAPGPPFTPPDRIASPVAAPLLDTLDPLEPIMGVGRLVFHVALPDGRRIIRLEGVGRVQIHDEQPAAHLFRELLVTPLAEPMPADPAQILALKAQVRRIARHLRDDSEGLLSLLSLRDDRTFLYALTAFLPSLELLACDIREWVHDAQQLVGLQQRCLAAADADVRARFLLERTCTILERLGQPPFAAGALLN